MEVSFANQKLQKLCNNAGKLRGEYGSKCADKIKRRLDELKAAECLEAVSKPDCSYLNGRRFAFV